MTITLTEKAEKGLGVISSMMGDTFGEALRNAATSGKFGHHISQMACEQAFGTAWAHEGLERKQKSLVIIGALIAMGQLSELRNHVKIGVANGLTIAELEGVLVQACPYVGFPRIASATTAVVEALREIGMDPNVKTAEERGLL